MGAKNPQGAWGPYGGPAPGFRNYAWAKLDAGGSILAQSGNIAGVTKGSAGTYTFQPVSHITESQTLALAISNQNVPVTFAYEYDDLLSAVTVTAYIAGVATDADFVFFLFLTN